MRKVKRAPTLFVAVRMSRPMVNEVRSVAELADENFSVTLRRLVRLGLQALERGGGSKVLQTAKNATAA